MEIYQSASRSLIPKEVCPYCKDRFGDGAEYVCSSCRTTMHQECFEENKGCVTMGCGVKAKTWPCCPKCQEQLSSQGAVVCVTCGFHIERGEFLPRPARLGSALRGVDWDVDHAAPGLRNVSWIPMVFWVSVGVALCGSYLLLEGELRSNWTKVLAVCLILMLVRFMSVEDT